MSSSRVKGRLFEDKVRKLLEEEGWTTCRWSNIVKDNKIVSQKPKYNPFTKSISYTSTGVPDFVCFKINNASIDVRNDEIHLGDHLYEVIGVECKKNKYCSKEYKEMFKFYLRNHTFSRILIAYSGEKRGSVEFIEFKENGGKA